MMRYGSRPPHPVDDMSRAAYWRMSGPSWAILLLAIGCALLGVVQSLEPAMLNGALRSVPFIGIGAGLTVTAVLVLWLRRRGALAHSAKV